MLAWVCGDVCIWKPSEKTPLCGLACQHIVREIFEKDGVPEGVSCLLLGGREIGEWMFASYDLIAACVRRYREGGVPAVLQCENPAAAANESRR